MDPYKILGVSRSASDDEAVCIGHQVYGIPPCLCGK